MEKKRVVHYVNQFYSGIGGEEKAGIPLSFINGATHVGRSLEAAFNGAIEVVLTIFCGDNFAAENPSILAEKVVQWVQESDAALFVAGPSFAAGRYGMACAVACQAVAEKLGLPVMAAMEPSSPGVDMCKRVTYIVPASNSARSMHKVLQDMGKLGIKLLTREKIGLPHEEGYIPRGIRVNVVVEKRGSRRGVDMLLRKLSGQPFTTELPIPVFDRVSPAPAVKDMRHALIAIGTEGGIVPKGNPDKIEAHNASKWCLYPIAGVDTLAKGEYEVAHGGYDPVVATENPNRVLPLDVARACQKESLFGGLFDKYPVTVGNVTAVRSAERYGREIGAFLKEQGVEGIVLTST